mmetsp:Transcript_3095/g.7176  ORF Transcript_3095/g.7176 Transcript_3095/m.7176 type:complete len:203 (+) Transcript_3095:1909-2517(+)
MHERIRSEAKYPRPYKYLMLGYLDDVSVMRSRSRSEFASQEVIRSWSMCLRALNTSATPYLSQLPPLIAYIPFSPSSVVSVRIVRSLPRSAFLVQVRSMLKQPWRTKPSTSSVVKGFVTSCLEPLLLASMQRHAALNSPLPNFSLVCPFSTSAARSAACSKVETARVKWSISHLGIIPNTITSTVATMSGILRIEQEHSLTS